MCELDAKYTMPIKTTFLNVISSIFISILQQGSATKGFIQFAQDLREYMWM